MHSNCFPSSFVTDGKNGRGLKLEKIVPVFQVLGPIYMEVGGPQVGEVTGSKGVPACPYNLSF